MRIKQRVILFFLLISTLIAALGIYSYVIEIRKAEHIAKKEAGAIATAVAIQVINTFDEKKGEICCNKCERKLQQVIEHFKTIQKRNFVVVDNKKKIVAAVITSEIGATFYRDMNNEIGKTLLDGKTRTFTEISPAYPGGIKQIVVRLSSDTGKTLGALILEYTPLFNEIAGNRKKEAILNLFLYLITLGIALIIGHRISKKIIDPLLAVKNAAVSISKGDYGSQAIVKSSDEIGEMAAAFNAMSVKMRDTIADLNREVAERKQAEDAVRESENKFRMLFNSINDSIFINNLEGKFIDLNDAACKRLGYSREELLGMSPRDIDTPETAKNVPDNIRNVIQKGEHRFESEQITRNGLRIPVDINAKLIDFGGKKSIIAVCRDITERKKIEEELKRHRESLEEIVIDRTRELRDLNIQLVEEMEKRKKTEDDLLKSQKLESLGVLAGGIAHDFNNYLTAIINNIQLMKMSIDDKESLMKKLNSMDKASTNAIALTKQLLTFSKGGFPVKKITNINELVRDAAQFALRGTKVRCNFSLAPDAYFLNIDSGLMTQAVGNLIINAYQSMPEGGHLEVISENIELPENNDFNMERGKYVKLTIRDMGVGIPAEHIEKIFDPYFTTKKTGSGLGLSSVYSIVKKHGGHISVESEPGKGSSFYIYLKSEKVTKEREEDKINKHEPLPAMKTARILLMDDDPSVAESTVALMEEFGNTITHAKEGREAIDLYKRAKDSGHPFDLVILDLTVPGGMGGDEAIKKLLEIDPDVKAVVSSGYSESEIMSQFEKHGFKGVLVKPYRFDAMYELLTKFISG